MVGDAKHGSSLTNGMTQLINAIWELLFGEKRKLESDQFLNPQPEKWRQDGKNILKKSVQVMWLNSAQLVTE